MTLEEHRAPARQIAARSRTRIVVARSRHEIRRRHFERRIQGQRLRALLESKQYRLLRTWET
jgi:hypothetical protein